MTINQNLGNYELVTDESNGEQITVRHVPTGNEFTIDQETLLNLLSVESVEATIDGPTGSFNTIADESALKAGTSTHGHGLVLQNADDSVGNGEGRSSIFWYSNGDATGDPESIASMTAHPSDNHFSVYTRESAIGSGSNTLNKRLDIYAGSTSTRTVFSNCDHLTVGDRNTGNTGDVRVIGDAGSQLSLRGATAGNDQIIDFMDGGSTHWKLFKDASQGTFRLFNHSIPLEALSFQTSDNGMALGAQDLSTVSGTDGRIYRHDGSASITADGATTSSPGYYVWSASGSEWRAMVQY